MKIWETDIKCLVDSHFILEHFCQSKFSLMKWGTDYMMDLITVEQTMFVETIFTFRQPDGA